MLRKLMTGVICTFAILASQQGAMAQPTATDSQTFNVVVESQLSIQAPATVSIIHDQTDTNQVFAAQGWLARCNNGLGGTVSFSTATPFQAVVGATTYRRNAQMGLAVGTSDVGSGWATVVSSATATTVSPVATVSAASTAPGDATLNLSMTFVDNNFSALPAATFSTTVTATITAN